MTTRSCFDTLAGQKARTTVTEKLLRISMEIEGWPITLVGSRQGISTICLGADLARQAPETPPWVEKARRQLAEYLAGRRRRFDLPLQAPQGTPFQKRVWSACREIPYGRISSYGHLARRLGSPGAARAVGQALGDNPLPLIVPCHRVVSADGQLGGFSAGVQWKRRLLRLENARPDLWSWNHEGP